MSVLAVLNALFLVPDLLVQPNNVSGLSSSSTSNGFASAFNQLATDLKSDNLSAAQKAYATVQPDLQSFAPPAHCHHHHSAGLHTSSTSPNFLGNFSPRSSGICSPVIFPRPNRPTPQFNRNSRSLAPLSPLPLLPPRATP